MSRPADLNSLLANVDAPAATFRQQRFDAGGPVARRAGGDTAEVLLGPAGETVKIGRRSLRAMRLCRDAADQQVLDAVTIENLDQTLDVRLAWLRQIWLPSSRVTNRPAAMSASTSAIQASTASFESRRRPSRVIDTSSSVRGGAPFKPAWSSSRVIGSSFPATARRVPLALLDAPGRPSRKSPHPTRSAFLRR